MLMKTLRALGATLALVSLLGSAVAQNLNPQFNNVRIAGCTLGADELCITGSAAISGALVAGSLAVTSATIPANGVYLSAANEISFSTNSVQRARITSTGINSAAIGATTPSTGQFTTGGFSGASTFGGAITYGGVTFANAVTGTGNMVGSISPALTTPNLGTPSAVTLTNGTGLPIGSGVSGLGAGVATFLATPSGANFAAAVTGETGTGAPVFDTGPTISAPTFTGVTNISGALRTSTQSAPAQITANQNDYNPGTVNCTATTTLLINSDAARNITGLAAPAAGCRMTLINNGSFTITLKEQDAGSTAANRFNMGGDYALAANSAVTLIYDGAASRWRNASSISAGAGTGTVTSVTCGTGLTGGVITTSGTCALDGPIDGNFTVPTVTSISNLDATPTPGAILWQRVKSIVSGSIVFTLDPTTTAATSFRFTVPVASNFTSTAQANGNCGASALQETGIVTSDATNDQLIVSFLAASTVNHNMNCTFFYIVQ